MSVVGDRYAESLFDLAKEEKLKRLDNLVRYIDFFLLKC